jgi:hypothetical protein
MRVDKIRWNRENRCDVGADGRREEDLYVVDNTATRDIRERRRFRGHSIEKRADERWDSQKQVKRTVIWGNGENSGKLGQNSSD